MIVLQGAKESPTLDLGHIDILSPGSNDLSQLCGDLETSNCPFRFI